MITQEEYEEAQEIVWDYEDQLKEQGKAFDTSNEPALNIDNVSLSFKEGDDIVVCDDLRTMVDSIDSEGKIWFYTNEGTRSWADSIDIKHYSS